MRVVGVMLIVLGLVALIWQGFTIVTRETIFEAGPLQLTADRVRTVYLPPILGGLALGCGVLLAFLGGRARA